MGAERAALAGEVAGRGRGSQRGLGGLLCQDCSWFLRLPSTTLAGPIYLQSEFHLMSGNLPRR